MTENNRSFSNLSEVYHALRAQRRRYVIQFISNSDKDSLTVRTLAKQIAAKEENISTDRATGEPYRNVYNALSQTHLPTLSSADLIIYDPDRQTVSPGSNILIAELIVAMNKTIYHILEEKL